jgi:hypothetical protein
MNSPRLIDEDLVRRLPVPQAQLDRRARNARSPLERHLTAFYLWEAALKRSPQRRCSNTPKEKDVPMKVKGFCRRQ